MTHPGHHRDGQSPLGNNATGPDGNPQTHLAGRTALAEHSGVAVTIAVASAIAVVVLVLADHGSRATLVVPHGRITIAPTQPSTQDRSPGTSPAGPTGQKYRSDEQPVVGDCVDPARDSAGKVMLYRATCTDPDTPLILESIQDQRCPANGYASIRGSTGVLCFTWAVRIGDCLDLYGPRKAPCSATATPSGNGGTITITQVKPGATDGAGCSDPNRFLQTGAGPHRGIACFMPTSMISGSNPTTAPR